jgi:hypothetical protein
MRFFLWGGAIRADLPAIAASSRLRTFAVAVVAWCAESRLGAKSLDSGEGSPR